VILRVSVFGLLFGARVLAAQSSPEDVVRAFFKAEREGRWIDAARFMDLQRFERLRSNALSAAGFRSVWVNRTADDLMKQDPEMPRAAAEYQLKKMNESMRDYDFLSHQFARTPTLDSLRVLPVEEVAARWLEAKGPDWAAELRTREQKRHPDPGCPQVPDSITAKLRSERPQATVLGATTGSDSVRYVVVGTQQSRSENVRDAGDRDIESLMTPSVMTVKRIGGAWKILPRDDMPNSMGMPGNITFVQGCNLVRVVGEEPKR
jgi:hypothetical protein